MKVDKNMNYEFWRWKVINRRKMKSRCEKYKNKISKNKNKR
jgi:hypothetical protein